MGDKRSTFRDLNLFSWLEQQCSALGLEYPTPVQYHCIPKILEGKDCISESQTGTGKTLAFALPILQELSKDPYGIFALVLTPTRELAYQIAQQFKALGEPILLKVSLVVGGVDMIAQAKELSCRPHVVIATPGRLLDHLQNSTAYLLKRVKFLVLDESDRLLEGNFIEQLPIIFDALPQSRQTLLFSATMTKTLEELKNITSEPFIWSSEKLSVTVEKLEQKYILTPQTLKDAHLVQVIQTFEVKNPGSLIMVFTKTCKSCQLLSMALNKLGFKNVALNSMLSQKERIASLTKFKSGSCKILIATDVASRGLDIPSVDLVINHNVSSVAKDYVHRVGRTARAGRVGLAITLVTPLDIRRLHAIEDLIKVKLTDYKPVEKKVLTIVTQVNMVMREAEIILGENDFGEKKKIYKRKKKILDGLDPDECEENNKLFNLRKKKRTKQKNLNGARTQKEILSQNSEGI